MINNDMEVGEFVASSSNKLQLVFQLLSFAVVFCLIGGVIIPLSPAMPGWGLDASWVQGVQYATANKLAFGTDLIFTFGPYAGIYTRAYNPQTDILMLFGSTFLSLSYSALIFIYCRKLPFFAAPVASLILALLFAASNDVSLLAYPLLLALSFTQFVNQKLDDRAPLWLLLLGISAMGLLPLTKGTLILLCSAILLLCISYAMWRKQFKLSASLCVLPTLAMLAFWILAGQKSQQLPAYFVSIKPIISGYTNAMSALDNWKDTRLYLYTTAILWLLSCIRRRINSQETIIAITLGIYLFILFKAGFVRSDPGHIPISLVGLLTAAILLFRFNGAIRTLLICAACLYLSHKTYQTLDIGSMSTKLTDTYRSAYQALYLRVVQPQALLERYDEALARIAQQHPLPELPGTTDIYSYSQAELLASNNRWQPRPILQSYSAYTPQLAYLNEAHLRGNSAPDNIIFRFQPIDGRLATTEDGPSWLTILQRYIPQNFDKTSIYYRKLQESQIPPAHVEKLIKRKARIGEVIELPVSTSILYARLDLQESLLGKLSSLVFKNSILHININLRDGSQRQYRLVAGMAQSGFILSPLIESMSDLLLLSSEDGRKLGLKDVQSFTVTSSDNLNLWKPEFEMEISAAVVPNYAIDLSRSFSQDVSSEFNVSHTISCRTTFDQINGRPLRPPVSISQGALDANGWAFFDDDRQISISPVVVTLTDESGRIHAFASEEQMRPDVSSHFKLPPEMVNSGFRTRIDIRKMQGAYTLGIGRISNGEFEACRQVQVPITIH